MTQSLGQRLLAAAPRDRVALHEAAWPADARPYEALVGRVLARVLTGEHTSSLAAAPEDGGPRKLEVHGLDPSERALLDERLPAPPPPDRRRPAAGRVTRWAIELPRAVRIDPRFSRGWAPETTNLVEFSDGSTMLFALVIDPILGELTEVFRVRSGEGPHTTKGRRGAVQRSIEAHETLGLDRARLSPILDPSLDANGVMRTRAALVESWAACPPDLGARAMALLCTRLAHRYYAKAKKDGTARRAQVITSTVEPLLKATLGEWEALLAYLGQSPAEPDARPLDLGELVLPPTPPEPVQERLTVAHDWFRDVFGHAHAQLMPGSPSLWGLVPEVHVFEQDDQRGSSRGYNPNRWETGLPTGMADQIRRLWGTTTLKRHPNVLVTEAHPETGFAVLLKPAAQFWEGISLTCWFLCFGPYSRTTLGGAQDYYQHALDELTDLGCPVEPKLFDDLIEAGEGADWLFEQASVGVSISISITEDYDVEIGEPAEGETNPGAAEMFLKLRDVNTKHRDRWIDQYLARYLDARWRRDLGIAGNDYRELHVGRGKPPTVKQAFPKLIRAANTWFGGDLSELARTLHLEGPVTEPMPRSHLELPADMRKVRQQVCDELGGKPDAEGAEYWPLRRRYELSQQVGDVLALWQASAELPPRTAFGRNWLLKEAFPGDIEGGYLEYIGAIRNALRDVKHPAADAPLAKGRGAKTSGN